MLAPREQIVEAINRHYGQTETESVDSMIAEFTDTQIDLTETEAAKQFGRAEEDSDAPVIKLVNLIMARRRSRLRCSDIHIEPFADRIRIRYRIDGVLVERDSPPRRLLAPMISRIKIMGNIDISEKRRPQDGRIKMTIKGKHLRSARQRPADGAWPIGGHARAGPRQHPGQHQGPGLRRGRIQASSRTSSNGPTASSW